MANISEKYVERYFDQEMKLTKLQIENFDHHQFVVDRQAVATINWQLMKLYGDNIGAIKGSFIQRSVNCFYSLSTYYASKFGLPNRFELVPIPEIEDKKDQKTMRARAAVMDPKALMDECLAEVTRNLTVFTTIMYRKFLGREMPKFIASFCNVVINEMETEQRNYKKIVEFGFDHRKKYMD